MNAAAKTTSVAGPTNELGAAVSRHDGADEDGTGVGVCDAAGVGECEDVGAGVYETVGARLALVDAAGATLATNGVGDTGHCFSWTQPAANKNTAMKTTKANAETKFLIFAMPVNHPALRCASLTRKSHCAKG